ncbi:MAG: hypothetical protein ACOYXY_16090, partial [Thermodesulfobacteriota bacterium]
GAKSCIFVHRSPGNELPGYYQEAPLGLTISGNLVILTPVGYWGFSHWFLPGLGQEFQWVKDRLRLFLFISILERFPNPLRKYDLPIVWGGSRFGCSCWKL